MLKNNVLITGMNGFIGSHLSELVKSKNDNVIAIVRDSLPSLWLSKVYKNVTIIQGDIRNYNLVKRVINHYDVNQVYHLASFANVKQAYKDPFEVYTSNINGTLNILEACRTIESFNKNDGKIVVLNTDKVYGEKMDAIETDVYCHSEPYATSKCCQGFMVKSYQYTYDINIKMAHSCNVFGYDLFNSRLVSNIIKNCMVEKSPVIFTNDNSIREYVYVEDTVNALYRIMNSENLKDTYNINTGWIYNQKDLILKIIENYNELMQTNIIPKYEIGNIPIQIQNESMSSINWDWKPKWDINDALKTTISKFFEYRKDLNI